MWLILAYGARGVAQQAHSNVLRVLCAPAFLVLCVNGVRKAVAGA